MIEHAPIKVWHDRLKAIAREQGYEWLIIDCGAYQDYFDDGCSPEETLENEIDAARSCC